MFSVKKFFYLFLVAAAIFFGYKVLAFFSDTSEKNDFSGKKTIFLSDNGLDFTTYTSSATIADFLKEKGIRLDEYDTVWPGIDSQILPGMTINIRRAVKIQIEADNTERTFYSLANSVEGAILENDIPLGEDDLVRPALGSILKRGMEITITRVEINEEVLEKTIDFKTIAEEDDNLGWRVKKIKQKGEKGTKEVTYKVVSHDGKEISRKILEEKITKDPVPEIAVQGTYVKIGKSHSGLGTWYAWKGGLFAASPWLPMGSFAKVTNKATGKSVIVQINDRGPFGPNRIIDLDKVAFAKIASIGAGVIDVKVEEVLN